MVAGDVVLVVIPRASLPSRSPEEISLLREAAVAWAMFVAFCLLSALAVMVRTRVSGGLVTVRASDRSEAFIFRELAAGSSTFGLVESSTTVGMSSLAWVEKEGESLDWGWMPKVVVATATGFVDRAIPSPARVHTSRMTRQATRFLRMAWRICEGCTLLLIWSGVGLGPVWIWSVPASSAS